MRTDIPQPRSATDLGCSWRSSLKPLRCTRLRNRPSKRRESLCPQAAGRGRRRALIQSDGQEHLGSALTSYGKRPFPGPSGNTGLPLKILPLGGLGEIGMNCMLVGVYDRFILIDAGLLFPDFDDHGMEKILPDTSFLSQWKDKIEAVVITHGHEDHIGAIPWVLPALDPNTPVYASGFVLELLENRLKQYSLWDSSRFVKFNVRERIDVGPFELEPIRVTHSIPDCCGLILRSDHGTIVHTGDWKIDEDPMDGLSFDREALEQVGKEGVTLLMSDSTNVLSPGRTTSESVVQKSIAEKVLSWDNKGRIIATMFASNLHRIGSIKAAADAAGRRICFLGMSLTSYLEAAQRSGYAPFDPRELIHPSDLMDINPNEVLVMTTGSQGEPYAALNMASRQASNNLKINQNDLIMYSAKMIPGNEKRVMKMMNRLSKQGPEIAMGRGELLHTSGHGYREELEEVIKLVQPQHFLPVHGESVFLQAHAEVAKELGIQRTMVIHDGDMVGVKHLMRKRTVSVGSMGSMKMLGQVNMIRFYNDGNKGTGTNHEMGLYERGILATEGVIVAAIDVYRPPRLSEMINKGIESGEIESGLRSRVRLTTRGIWTDKGRLVKELCKVAQATVAKCPVDSSLMAVEKAVHTRVRSASRKFNGRNSEVLVIAHEHDPRAGDALAAINQRLAKNRDGTTPGPVTPRYSTQRKKAQVKSNTRNPRTPATAAGKSIDEEGEGGQVLISDDVSTGSIETVESPEKEKKKVVRKRRTKTTSTAKKSEEGELAGSDGEGVKKKKSVAKKVTRKRVTKKTAAAAEKSGDEEAGKNLPSAAQLGDLVPVPEEILERRRRANPRENPADNPGADLDYG
ncbi:hypothetical protein BSKO_04983 [Bryopsis sp. KO-2023]|nr:hypothetical protein BSKO_04983 [Bryopsis sp. KO-2023]